MAQPSTTATPSASSTAETGFSLVLITAAVLAASLMQGLDTTIVNVALPIIQGNLGATIDEGAWVVTGYIISAVIVIPLTPWLQLRFGRRQYYAVAIIGFTIASVWCGLSDNIVALVLWRIVQGAFGGGLIATAQATLRDTFPKDKVALSQGIFLLGAVVGPAVGPTLGGWLTDNYAWNWVFFINIVPGTFAAIVILMRLKNPTQPTRLPFDFVGLGLLIAGLGSLQYVLGEGQRDDWFSDATISTLVGVSVVSLVAFAFWEIFGSRHPVVDLRVLRVPQIAAGGLLTFSFGSILYGSLVLLPQYAEGALGFTATLSGQLIFVRAVFIALGAPIAVRLAADKRLDLRFILLLGFSLLGVSQLWFANVTTSGSDFGSFVGASVLGGLGISMLFIPISVAVLSSLEPQVAPKAAAFQSLWQQLGGSISTALLVTMLAQREGLHQDALAQYASLVYVPVQLFLSDHGSLNILYSNIIMQASVMSYADCQRILGYLAFALLPIVFVLPKRKKEAASAHISLE
jgi:DHA2 family multidrug resistance protein